MAKKIIFSIFIGFGLALCLTGTIGMLTINSVMWDNQTIRFSDSLGNSIYNKYYPGTKNKGVMIFHGFGEDQTSMRAIANDLIRYNFHVFTTDFSGHGRSSGVLGEGNESFNPLVDQVLLAKEQFKVVSSLVDSEIILIGHSMGASTILRAAFEDTNNLSSLILIGGGANISENSTGNWIDDLGPTNPACNVQIITGTWEDILTPNEAIKLYNKLSNSSEILTKGEIVYSTNSSEGFNYELWNLPRQVHSYEPISLRVSNKILEFCMWEGNPHIALHLKSFNFWRVVFLPFLTVGLFISVIFGILLTNEFSNSDVIEETVIEEMKIISMKRFLGFKPLIWIGSYAVGILPAAIIFPIPVGKPYFTFIYLIPFFGFGIMSLLLHLIGKLPGIEGKWKPKFRISLHEMNWITIIITLTISILIVILSSFLINSSLYHIFPTNIRLFWFFIFSLLTFLGFFFILKESMLIQKTENKNKFSIALFYFILYFPFILATIFIGVSGTLIYFFDGLHSLAIILFVLLTGELLIRILRKPIIISIFQSFLLFLLLTPRGPLTLTFF